MKKLFIPLLGAILMFGNGTSLSALNNLTEEIPIIGIENSKWTKVPDAAQYGLADWNNVVGRAQNVSVKEAMEIAESNPEITFFFIMKGMRMQLGNPPNVRVFHYGDAVFFSGEPWWGSAHGFADGYVKKQAE